MLGNLITIDHEKRLTKGFLEDPFEEHSQEHGRRADPQVDIKYVLTASSELKPSVYRLSGGVLSWLIWRDIQFAPLSRPSIEVRDSRALPARELPLGPAHMSASRNNCDLLPRHGIRNARTLRPVAYLPNPLLLIPTAVD